MTIVITYGTFDLFHIGHLRILQRAKQLGNKLYVGISSDEFNTLKKNRVFSLTHKELKLSKLLNMWTVSLQNNHGIKKKKISFD